MKRHIRGGKSRFILGGQNHGVIVLAQQVQFLFGHTGDCQLAQGAFHDTAEFQQFAEFLLCQAARDVHAGHGVTERIFAYITSVADARLDQAFAGQLLERIAHGHAAGAEYFTQL